MPEREREFTIIDLTGLFARRRSIIAGAAIILGIFFLFYALAAYPVYQSKGSIQISSQGGAARNVSQILSFGAGSSPINTEVEIIQSRSISQAVIDQLGMSVKIEDAAWGGPATRAVMFLVGDRLKRNLRSLEISSVSFPESSIDKYFLLTFTDDAGGFSVTGPGGSLGSGRKGVPFQSDSLSFTAISMTGPAGSKFKLKPRSEFDTMKSFRDSLSASTLGGAGRTDLIQVNFKNTNPQLAADVVNAIMAEYDKRDHEWELAQGNAQTDQIDAQIKEAQDQLKAAEESLEKYQNDHGVVALSEEATAAVTDLALRETQRADLNTRLTVLQDIHKRLATQLSGNDFSLPPSLTLDTVIQQLAADNARQMVEYNDLLLEYTENHPLVVAKKQEITKIRESILQALSATITGLVEQISSMDSVIGTLNTRLDKFPGVERQLLEMTRARDVADQAFRLLMQRKSEAELIQAGVTVGNRIIDPAIPPAQPDSPKLKQSLGFGLGLGVVLGLFLAFLLEILDPRIRKRDDLLKLIGAVPVMETHRDKPEEISRASSMLSLAAMKSESGMLALIKPGPETPGWHVAIQNVIAQLSTSLQPILLVDGSGTQFDQSFFGLPVSPGLSEIASGQTVNPIKTKDYSILILPTGSFASGALVGNRLVRERIDTLKRNSVLTLISAPNEVSEPAMRSWGNFAGAVVLVVEKDLELKTDIAELVDALNADKVPILGAILIAS